MGKTVIRAAGARPRGKAWLLAGGLLLLCLLADWRACRAMCLLDTPSVQDYSIEEKRRALAAKHGLQLPDADKSVMDAVMERKKQEYKECIDRAVKVLRELGQDRYELTPVQNGSFKRDKITGRMWFEGPDGEREISLHR